MSIIDEIKQRVKIEDLVATMYTIVGQGRVRTTQEHDSLKLWVEQGTWYWFSRGLGGDVLDWYALVHRCDLRTAVQELARAAGVELRPLTEVEQEERTAAQRRAQVLSLAADHYHHTLMRHPGAQAARTWCEQRGWTMETLERERVGYVLAPGDVAPVTAVSPVDKNGLSPDELPPLAKRLQAAGLGDEPLAKAVLSIPAGMIVYAHREAGQVRYLAGRSVEGKRHYNLPEEFSGGKVAYCNEPAAGRRGGVRLLVEGQADAVALGQLGFDAVALCGLHAPGMDRISHVALDNDGAGQKRAVQIALGLGPLTPVVTWPSTFGEQKVKDGADLVRLGATAEVLGEMLEDASPALVRLAEQAKRAHGDDRQELMRQVMDAFLGLDDITAADLKPVLARAMGIGMAQFNRVLKARQKEAEEQDDIATDSKYRVSAAGYVDGHLFEQYVEWRADGTPASFFYVRKPDGQIERQQFLTVGRVTYTPIAPDQDENISMRTVLFPSHLVEYGSEKQLLREIREFIHRWLDIDPAMERIVSYYVLFSWFYDAGFHTIPYLRALGDYGTGKTRFIETIGFLCYRPMLITGGDSEPVIFRMIHLYKGTMVVDEADFKDSEANALISKIINLGNRINGCIKRLETVDNQYVIRVYRVFCPKVFAAREAFQDQASDSRCLTHFTTRSSPRPDIPSDTDETFYEEAAVLRNKLSLYRLRNWRPMQIDQKAEMDRSIMPRLNQVTMALRAIIQDPIALAEMAAFVRDYNASLIQDRGLSREAIVVQAMADLHYGPADMYGNRDYSMKNIAEKAQAILAEVDPEDKAFSSRGVTDILNRKLGLREREVATTKADRGRTVLKFTPEQLQDLMQRYGIVRPE